MTDKHITVEPCVDEKYIDAVFAHSDANASDYLGFSPAELVMTVPGTVFLRVKADGEPAGGFLLFEINGRAEGHTALFPNVRGRDAVKAGRLMLDWVRANKPWTSLHSYAPTNRPEVIWFALRCGLTRGAIETLDGAEPVTIQHLSIKL